MRVSISGNPREKTDKSERSGKIKPLEVQPVSPYRAEKDNFRRITGQGNKGQEYILTRDSQP